MGWWAWLLAAWRNRREIEQTGEAVAEAVEELVSPAEPSQPLSHRDVEHMQQQQRSAVAAAKALNVPKVVPLVDRDAPTPPHGRPIPPLPPSKRSPRS